MSDKEALEERVEAAEQRTDLAGERTTLSAERTYAAWMRTGLAALATGVGARAVLREVVPNWVSGVAATALVAFAGFCLVAAVWRLLGRGIDAPAPEPRALPRWLLIAVNIVLLAVVLAALVGLWVA